MQHTATRPARMPVRVALAALLLAGLGLWQSWQCAEEMTPLLLPVTTVAAAAGHEHAAMTWHPEPPSHGDGHGLLAACLSVLASLAAAFWLMADPLRALARLRRAALTPVRAAGPPPRAATLAQLCILRT